MKTLSRLLKEFFLLQRFQVYAFLFLLVFSLTSCFRKYYGTNTVIKTDSATLHKLVDENKTFILHGPEGAIAVKNATVSIDVFSGEKGNLNPANDGRLNPDPNIPHHLKKKEKVVILNEVHLYTRDTFPQSGKVNLEISQIYRMDVYGFDKKATRDSRALSIVGISLGAGIIVGIAASVAFGGELFGTGSFGMHL